MLARICLGLACAGLVAGNAMPQPTQPPAYPPVKRADETSSITAITGCHGHGSDLYCMAGTEEFKVSVASTVTSVPASFTDCHSHGSSFYCVDDTGGDVLVDTEGTSLEGQEDSTEEESGSADGNQHCHEHAGIPHCVGGSSSESDEVQCGPIDREYDVPLRVGLLFVILATSALGVYGPILLYKWMPTKLSVVFLIMKQFGTGIIISTAFVHLYSHATLMFANQCVGDLGYEGTVSAIVMAGLFLSFVVEYAGQRVVQAKIKSEAALTTKERANAFLSSEVVSILVMEIGIVFHSLLIGLTLVVSGDSFFITLFCVILFHQMFEGIALGTRIATVGAAGHAVLAHGNAPAPTSDSDKGIQQQEGAEISSTSSIEAAPVGLSMKKQLSLAALFAFITPIGMAIGIGVLDQFNGRNRATLIAIGTLDAVSAGILIWVGVVEMWAGDWMTGSHGHKAELADASILTVTLGGAGLIAGLIIMSVLGKWA